MSRCSMCHGSGQIEIEPGRFKECSECNGSGSKGDDIDE